MTNAVAISILAISSLAFTAGLAAESGDRTARFSVKDPARAKLNWLMNCQGCHGVKGEGSPGGAPAMPGVVAKFLTVEGGRQYLAQVPGVANAPLSDEELSDLMNWMINRFACGFLPDDVSRFSATEIATLRDDVLITDAHLVRAALMSKINHGSEVAAANSGELTPCPQ